MSIPQWTPLSPPVLTGHRHTTALADDPARGAVLVVQGAGVEQREAWRWTGEALVREADGLLPGRAYSTDMFGLHAAYDPLAEDVLVLGVLGHRDDPDARAPISGVVVTRLGAPGEEREWAYPPDLADDVTIAGFARVGERLLVLAVDGTVLEAADGADALAVVGGPLGATEGRVDFDPGRHGLRRAIGDPERGGLVAVTDDDGLVFGWTPAGGWERLAEIGCEGIGVAWHPVERRAYVISRRTKDEGPRALRPVGDLTSEGPALQGFTRNPAVVYVASRGEWLTVDRDHCAFSAAPDDAHFTIHENPLTPPVEASDDAWKAAVHSGGPLWMYRVDDGDWARLDGDAWVTGEARTSAIAATSTPGGLAILDDEGTLLRIVAGKSRPFQLAEEDDMLVACNADDGGAIAYDGERYVALSPVDEETFVCVDGEWESLDEAPGTEEGVVCATAAGIYRLDSDGLWLLGEEEWTPVHDEPTDEPAVLLFEHAGALWTVTADGLAVAGEDGFETVAEMPPGVAFPKREPGKIVLFDTGSRVLHDPVGRRLIVHGGGGLWTLDLDGLEPEVGYPGGAVARSTGAREPRAAASCYVLEVSGESRWRTMSYLAPFDAVYALIADVKEFIQVRHGYPEDLGYALELTTTSVNWWVWTVEAGVLTDRLELSDLFAVRFADGSSRPTTVDELPYLWEREAEAVAVELDEGAVRKALRALPEPVLTPGEAVEVSVAAGGVAPDADSVLADGAVLRMPKPGE